MSGTAFLFPGQGSQTVGMDAFLHEYPEAAGLLANADELSGVVGLSRVISEGPIEELTRTDLAQPAITIVSLATLSVLRARGIEPDMVAGHSLGEYSALVAAGVISASEALSLVRHRGELMQDCVNRFPVGMTALLGTDYDSAMAIVRESAGMGPIGIANMNSSGQVVISGAAEPLQRAGELAREAGVKRVIPLRVSGAWHSPLMDEAAAGLRSYLDDVVFEGPAVPVVANVTADYVELGEESRNLLERQVTSPVLWSDSMKKLVDAGADTFVEVGPGRVLQGLLRGYDSIGVYGTGSAEALEKTIEALGG